MHLDLHGKPILLTIAVWACTAGCLAGAAAIFYSIILVLGRTGALVDTTEERSLGWSERAGRRNSRFNRFLVADEFRSLRKLLFGAWAGFLVSFGLLSLLIFLFGERTLT
ncbi:hypothetical protein EN962_16610 [Mesorhizobium sp. M7A.F.Ca.CA.001.09.2.1]|uniref:Lipoprotein n=2 Tax=Mesorhizobium TaxID=68287 RepID=A0AB38T3H0_9HYPH|nr:MULTISPECIES: hypothetical protein [Mesorhizobium]RUY32533.1 hypothetical protein EN981_30810 [Mesorhizobium sp. M7A.F.Ca.CA.001.13.2.1]RUZ25177.1 hypothetical protein EN953_29495 [Mesorhizobium sp. M7A.F.Ca.CA.001.04.1.1]RUZ61427.1 hypothetical protein EN947_34830 [Mesorhizobium sp. M7A.F.Ca.US.003.02.2.1]MBZ9891879.1 hypothetical protein [Mesorhizobium sp. BR1-1-3]MDF3212689.1 hypothetical protein [Mesorhizobium ciceri]